MILLLIFYIASLKRVAWESRTFFIFINIKYL